MLAAQAAGLKMIILPERNRARSEIPPEPPEAEFVFVDTAEDVLWWRWGGSSAAGVLAVRPVGGGLVSRRRRCREPLPVVYSRSPLVIAPTPRARPAAPR